MTSQSVPTSRKSRKKLYEIAKFYRAQQLASGNSLPERISQVERTVHPADWTLIVWGLGSDSRSLVADYASSVGSLIFTDGIVAEFDRFQQLLSDISEYCKSKGLEQLRQTLQQEIFDRAAENHTTGAMLQASILNPVLSMWSEDVLRDAAEGIIRRLYWPGARAPEPLKLDKVLTGSRPHEVTVTVLVGE